MPPSSVYRLTSVAASTSAARTATRRTRLPARGVVTRVGGRVDKPTERARTGADVFMAGVL
jgi:hypothetical protein